VNDYLLFIDTEASGLPKNWELPYAAPGNWPYIVQLSWIVYSRQGVKIKEQDHYIKDDRMVISREAARIHRLRKDFLGINGERRHEVLARLAEDLSRYEPLIVGHFLKLDLDLIGAECFRASMDDPTKGLPTYCTMLATRHLQDNPAFKYLKLAELYATLFNLTQENQHDALSDASATAACYFELERRALSFNHYEQNPGN
jgi:DNA polymerase-3 subunit epsilon